MKTFRNFAKKYSKKLNSHLSKSFSNKIKFAPETINDEDSEETYSFSNQHFKYLGNNPYWTKFKNIRLRSLVVKALFNVEVIFQGVVVNDIGEIELESTIFQKEYLYKLKCNHLIYFRKFFPFKFYNKAIILSNYLERNYYHWILESVGRLVIIDKNVLNEYKIILNHNAPIFAIESLQVLFNIPPENIIQNKNVRLKIADILLPSYPHTRSKQSSWTNINNQNIIKKINSISKTKTISTKQKRNIIISRNKTSQRRIKNVHYLLEKYKHLNFEIIDLESFSFLDQLQLFRNAGIILATHGAGLTNIIFSENPSIIEFFPSNRNKRDAFYFYQISNALNFNHTIIEYTCNHPNQDFIIENQILNQLDIIFGEQLKCN
ncbi:glycosyltransferase family 61 protein [Aestuariibaculum sediminum]|uniref:Glycosyltransferase family 61 protein n=1 Tax=Aestuariibaculum sediminum TaxID=2770637 RepID=A0A8J6UDR1_9FLAO|nr:glycosyltransferase family 61 protein [Aestuariibaculum sediminum]MBD0833069.1 glycosyltransferase family 61 protein [Aestuariibaculum sediminum]